MKKTLKRICNILVAYVIGINVAFLVGRFFPNFTTFPQWMNAAILSVLVLLLVEENTDLDVRGIIITIMSFTLGTNFIQNVGEMTADVGLNLVVIDTITLLGVVINIIVKDRKRGTAE